MNFGPQHYVPILKVKLGEKAALRGLPRTIASWATPLLEIVERTDKEIHGHLKTAFTKLADSLQPFDRCFLDARELAPDGAAAADLVFETATTKGIRFTPVTGISRSADVSAALQHSARGLAIRLTRDEFENGGLSAHLNSFVAQHGITHLTTDLIVDLGTVENLVVEGISALTDAFLADLPDLSAWRTLTVAACAFPTTGVVSPSSHVFVERAAWTAWRDHLYARRSRLSRLPTFGDCGIQRPEGVENIPFQLIDFAAAIRYTTKDDEWLLLKGKGRKAQPHREQFPRLATDLVYGHLRGHFLGPDHCAGCQGAVDCANGQKGFGSLGKWRQLGTNHHITLLVESLKNLAWP